jgi:hypothetical protein
MILPSREEQKVPEMVAMLAAGLLADRLNSHTLNKLAGRKYLTADVPSGVPQSAHNSVDR